MVVSIIFLLISFLTIVLASESFTNGIEFLGRRYRFSQAVVGNVFAAVGTALPETILPLVAIFWGLKETGHEIGVGAILGAPFMLSTLTLFLTGITVFITFLQKKRKFVLDIEITSIKRDMIFFLTMYSLAIFVPIIAGHTTVIPIAVILIVSYVFYVYSTFRDDSADVLPCQALYLIKGVFFLNLVNKRKVPILFLTLLQIVLSVVLMIFGAKLFVNNLGFISGMLGLSPLFFALIIAPVATELPEKINSITWIIKGKDALAIGNITGAMVFQTTFPVSIGLLFTTWKITDMALVSSILALSSGLIVLLEILIFKRISPRTFILSGLLYLGYICILFSKNIL